MSQPGSTFVPRMRGTLNHPLERMVGQALQNRMSEWLLRNRGVQPVQRNLAKSAKGLDGRSRRCDVKGKYPIRQNPQAGRRLSDGAAEHDNSARVCEHTRKKTNDFYWKIEAKVKGVDHNIFGAPCHHGKI